jgi:hypothetical protein
MPKRAKNLLLEPDALARGEEYCKRHETTLSMLVSDFLLALPDIHEPKPATSPIVQVLQRVAQFGPFKGESYRDYVYMERKRLTKRFAKDAYED